VQSSADVPKGVVQLPPQPDLNFVVWARRAGGAGGVRSDRELLPSDALRDETPLTAARQNHLADLEPRN